VITISVESDEEQWAIGTALVNGAIGFGNWPFEVKRRYSAGGGGSAGVSGAGVNSGCAGGGGSGRTISRGSGVITASAMGSGGGGTGAPDFFVCPLRTCCATRTDQGHREGCDEDG
jgi:hypothetical protein